MMRTKNGPISRQVVKVVHDDGDEQVDDEKRAQANKRDKVGNGNPAGAVLDRTGSLAFGRLRQRIAAFGALYRDHDLLPRFARRRSKQHEQRFGKRLKIVVPIYFRFACVVVQLYFAEQLHADYGVDEEEHHNE